MILHRICRRTLLQRFLRKHETASLNNGFASYLSKTGNSDNLFDDDGLQSRRMDFDHESLAARGYLRSQRPYTPPSDIVAKIRGICMEVSGSEQPDMRDPAVKLAVVSRCMKATGHEIPNSLLNTIKSADHLITFYRTPVDTRVPLDRMRDIELPRNLHVIYNYKRFHPETDTKFKGVTVFSGDSNIVTGLATKKKYKGFKNEPEWMKYNLEVEVNRHDRPIRKYVDKLLQQDYTTVDN